MGIIKPKRFFGLHAHDNGSVFDGLGLPSEHFEFVLKNGGDGLAITNHGHMNSFCHAYLYEKELHKKGINFKYIPGVEAYLHPDLDQWKLDHAANKEKVAIERELKKQKKDTEDEKDDEAVGLTVENEDESKNSKYYNPLFRRHHLVVLPKTSAALQRLFSMVSKSYNDGFYKFPRIDFKMLKEHAKNEFVISSACIAGALAYDVLEEFRDVEFDKLYPSLLDDDVKRAKILSKIGNTVDRLVDAVGEENFFIEIQFNKLASQHLVNRALIEYANKTGLKLVATADSHYPSPDLWREREIYKKLGFLNYQNYDPSLLPKSVDDVKAQLYPKNADQMWEEYKKTTEGMSFYDDQLVCDAIERSHDIAHIMIGNVKPDTSVKLPKYVSDTNKTATEALRELAFAGLKRKKLDTKDEYVKRLDYELDVIKQKNFEEYFLTMKRITDVAHTSMFVGAGRGSSAGALTNYLLDITELDPLKYELIFERFISMSRKEYPDIDCVSSAHRVVMHDETRKCIKELKVGDKVLDADGKPRKVLAVQTRPVNKDDVLYDIEFLVGNLYRSIVANGKHRLLLEDNSQIEVKDIKVGTKLKCSYDITVSAVRELSKENECKITLTDITVDGTSTFRLVPFTDLGRGDLWVGSHNSDFSDRDLLIDLLKEEFGSDNVLPISNYNTFKLKSLVKDVSKFFSIPFEEVNEATRNLDEQVRSKVLGQGDDKNLFELKYEDALEHSPEFKSFIDLHPEVAENLKVLLHQNRSLGRHAGGVVISDNLLDKMPAIRSGGELQTPWVEGMHYKHLNEVGLIKFDLLGLETLRIVQSCIEKILTNYAGNKLTFKLENEASFDIFEKELVKLIDGTFKEAKSILDSDELAFPIEKKFSKDNLK